MSLQFEYSTEGYKLAKAWLIDIGREDILTGGFSTDGWSVVAAANTIWTNKNIKDKPLEEQIVAHRENEEQFMKQENEGIN